MIKKIIMRKIVKHIMATIILVAIAFQSYSQGCVAIRSTGASCSIEKPGSDSGSWVFSANYRYFRSFRHFKGKEEQKERLVQNTEVINYTNSLDLSITKNLNNRWSVSLNFPLLAISRSSLYEHGLVNGVYVKKERHSTHSYGLGDVRFAAYRWLIDPLKHTKINVQAGLGIKFATGDYNYKDYWYNVGVGGKKELRTVDQSMQLGDGGTGFTTELNAYYMPSPKLNIYANTYYLINPRNVNGTRTYRETLSPAIANEDIMSVPDQYMARVGASYNFLRVQGLSVSAGGRIEGIPVYDLVGGSDAFRRPGYVISVEPGVGYAGKKTTWYLNVPVALSRNRTQSVTDKEMSKTTGIFRQGDAAFADYSINVGCAVRF